MNVTPLPPLSSSEFQVCTQSLRTKEASWMSGEQPVCFSFVLLDTHVHIYREHEFAVAVSEARKTHMLR